MANAQIQSFIHQIQAWFSQAKTTAPEDILQELPSPVITELTEQFQKFPTPTPYQTWVHEQLNQAIETWKNDENAPNSLVILANPVVPLSQILQESLNTWDSCGNLRFFPPQAGLSRPPDPLSMISQLQNLLHDVNANEAENTNKTGIVIPALEQCFLRCIQGWEGIEFLQNVISKDRSRFWLIGCNTWTWSFLDFVCQISVYLESVISLTPLSGEQLQGNFEPLMRQMTTLDVELCHESYWKSLANLASGVNSIAAHLWLESLRVRAGDIQGEDDGCAELTETDSGCLTMKITVNLRTTYPVLPSLPELTILDRYLLHSVLLHGRIRVSHLAITLGEPENVIRSRVQVLCRGGILWRQQGIVGVHPIYYPKLKAELMSNNFFVAQDL